VKPESGGVFRPWYEAWAHSYIADGTPLRAKLLFLLAWFHAVVQVRWCTLNLQTCAGRLNLC
jgi:hypothetical protein